MRGAKQTIDQAIIDAWDFHENANPEISTERLMQMVADDTGCDPGRQIAALKRAGRLTKVKQ